MCSKRYPCQGDYKFDLRNCEKCNIVFRPLKQTQFRCSAECSFNTINCKECDNSVKYYYKKKHRFFCSKKCRGKYVRRNRVIKKCLNCGVDIEITECHKETKKYCSRKCKDEYQCIIFAGENNPNFGNHVLLGKPHSDEQKENCRNAVLKSWENPRRLEKYYEGIENYKKLHGVYPFENLLTTFPRGKKGYYISNKTGITEYYHSSWEMIRMQELDNDVNVVFWTKKHKICIHLLNEPTNKKWYLPDFTIKFASGKTIIEEVKGYVRNEELFDLKCQKIIEFIKQTDEYSGYVVNFMKHLRNGKDKNKENISYYKI